MDTVIFCDIDGVIVPLQFPPGFVPDEELPKLRQKISELSLTEQIIQTINMLHNKANIIFVTGRPKDWEDFTLELLKDFKETKVCMHKWNGRWTREKYYKFKLDTIQNLSNGYDKIVVIDDILELLHYINDNAKDTVKQKLTLIHATFSESINNLKLLQSF